MEMKPDLVIKPRPSDFTFGDGNIPFKAVTNGDWGSHIFFAENQRNPNFETSGCVCYTAQESFDAQLDALWQTLPIETQAEIIKFGYMDSGTDGNAHPHTSPRFIEVLTGNGTNGNSMPEAWDVLRKFGALPWKDLPFDATMTQAEYFAPIPQNLLDKAAQFLALIGGPNAIKYHWIINDAKKNVSLMQSAILQSPLCLGLAVTDGWNQATPQDPPASQSPQHAVMGYKIQSPMIDVYDHYSPYYKVLDAGYPVSFVLQAVVSPLISVPPAPTPVPPPQPVPTNIQPTQQNINLLTQIAALYQKLLNLFQGRNLSGTTMNPSLYNIFKSRTFWTLVATFAYNVWQLIMPSVPAEYSALIDFIFTSAATYFHIAGVNASAQSSAVLGRAVSGQS